MSVLYAYTARSDAGRFVAGSFVADSVEAALDHLRSRSLFVTSLERAETVRGAATSALALGTIDPAAKVSFFRSFATLIGAGVSMQRALEVTTGRCRDARLREALRSVASDIEGGSTLSAALARRPRNFPPLWIAMIGAGELGGVLHDVLEQLAQLLESDRAMKKRVAAALAYPAIVTACALALILIVVASVVPAFAGMFTEMHVALPLSTRILIVVGDALQSPWVWLGAAFGTLALVLGLRGAQRSTSGAYRLDAVLLALPVFGSLMRKVAIARFARTLGTLLRAGVEIIAALEASENVVASAVYARCIRTVIASVRVGDPITRSLNDSGLFDGLFLQLAHVGEETGSLDAMLLRIADYYEIDIETSLAALGSVLEPILIVVMGAVVGTIVASIIIPLYSIIGSIK